MIEILKAISGLLRSDKISVGARSIAGKSACLVFSVAALAQLGCSLQGGISNLVDSEQLNDFKRTEIIAAGKAAADGVSELGLIVHLKNSDNTSVPMYKPEYTITDGVGVIPSECSTSDKNGISACILKATKPGRKKIKLTNALKGLGREVEFVPPDRGGRIIGLNPAPSVRATTAAGSKVEFSAADPIKGVVGKTANGSKVYISVQGAVISR